MAIADLDAYVERVMFAALDPAKWAQLRARGRVDSSGIAALEQQKTQTLEMFRAGVIDFDEWQQVTETLAVRIEAARSTPLALPDVDDIETAWQKKLRDDVIAKRLVITALVARLAIAPARKGVNRFDETRIDLRLID